MSAETAPPQTAPPQRVQIGDLAAIALCALIWGTTFYAITLQLGEVDPLVSVVYRFIISAALLFVWCKLSGEKMALTRNQHLAAIGLGVPTFAVNYPLVYVAEQWVTSAVVAIAFAAMAFVNLVMFRFIFGQRPSPLAWIGALLGVIGVALISWQEVATSHMGPLAQLGMTLALLSILAASLGNVAAHKGELEGAPVTSLTAWSMAYGGIALALFVAVTGTPWTFVPSLTYVGSLLYLSLFGSVIAFLLYFNLARRRGYGTAAYVSAIAPLVAMVVSGLFEGKSWGAIAFVAIALVLSGQILLLRARKA